MHMPRCSSSNCCKMLSSLVLVMLITLAFERSGPPLAQALKTECINYCGKLRFEYPFGIGRNCSLNDYFDVTCNNSSSSQKLILAKFNLELLQIHVDQIYREGTWSGQITVNMPVARTCADNSSSNAPNLRKITSSSGERIRWSSINLSGSPFQIYTDDNVFGSIGCDGLATMYNETGGKISGCSSSCGKDDDPTSRGLQEQLRDGCSGYYCGQSNIDPSDNGSFQKFSMGITAKKLRGCRSAFVISRSFLYYNAAAITAATSFVPVQLQWYYTTRSAQDFESGYSLSVLGTLLVSSSCIWSWWFYKTKETRKEVKLRAEYFKDKLEQSSFNRELVYKTKLFAIKELKKATDNFSRDQILGQGGQGAVYKGTLTNGQTIAVKRSQTFEESQWKQFINEVILLSQVNHRNVVKLLGCCLEMKQPLLVYEFVPNGTLSQHIHNPDREFVLTWSMRLRIASETADAIAYLHSSSTTPIYHRDIKSTNILLDEKFQAKVADFGISRAVSMDQTHLTTCVQGTIGYLDPEYFRSSQFSEKSDVYSLGVLLVELLTGQHPIRATTLEEERSLAVYFLSAMNESTLDAILDPLVLDGTTTVQVMAVARLAKWCLNSKGIERPTMKEVAMELGRLRRKPSFMLSLDQQASFEIEDDIFTRSSTLIVGNTSTTSTI